MTTDTPRIYVASLTDYNAGTLHGAWIDADQDADTIAEAVAAMLRKSPEARRFPQGGPAEEWAIHDYEGFDGISLSEWEPFELVAAIGEMVAEHGAAFAAWYDNDPSHDTDELAERFEDAFAGQWDSLADYAHELAEDCGYLAAMPEQIRGYFDAEAFARDLDYGGDVWTAPADGGGVYVFRSF